ncbi:hypothetical protein BC629DRAFT_1623072 [Irpex lacteus]|nr:hypothetical protein BC629DRAFT_1623072 [Irpex lacteus]
MLPTLRVSMLLGARIPLIYVVLLHNVDKIHTPALSSWVSQILIPTFSRPIPGSSTSRGQDVLNTIFTFPYTLVRANKYPYDEDSPLIRKVINPYPKNHLVSRQGRAARAFVMGSGNNIAALGLLTLSICADDHNTPTGDRIHKERRRMSVLYETNMSQVYDGAIGTRSTSLTTQSRPHAVIMAVFTRQVTELILRNFAAAAEYASVGPIRQASGACRQMAGLGGNGTLIARVLCALAAVNDRSHAGDSISDQASLTPHIHRGVCLASGQAECSLPILFDMSGEMSESLYSRSLRAGEVQGHIRYGTPCAMKRLPPAARVYAATVQHISKNRWILSAGSRSAVERYPSLGYLSSVTFRFFRRQSVCTRWSSHWVWAFPWPDESRTTALPKHALRVSVFTMTGPTSSIARPSMSLYDMSLHISILTLLEHRWCSLHSVGASLLTPSSHNTRMNSAQSAALFIGRPPQPTISSPNEDQAIQRAKGRSKNKSQRTDR